MLLQIMKPDVFLHNNRISIDKPNDSVIAIGNETANNLTVIIFEGRCQKGNLFGPIIT